MDTQGKRDFWVILIWPALLILGPAARVVEETLQPEWAMIWLKPVETDRPWSLLS